VTSAPETTPPVRIVRLTPDDWRVEREVRLAALAEAPYAFGSTLAETSRYDERQWRERLARQVRLVALAGDVVAGTAGFVAAGDGHPAAEALLVGMWVRPGLRGGGVGDALVRAVVRAAADAGHGTIRLAVTPGNDRAVALYARNGFAEVAAPDRLEPDMVEMIRPTRAAAEEIG
jgi:ribosomal protein S18 acetylase RimI-like enzyme